MTSMDTWTMVQLRAECAKLGITPGRGKIDTWDRITAARAKAARRAELAESAAANIKRAARGSGIAERHAAELAEVHARIGGPVPRVSRMSRLARTLCGSTALRGTFAAGHPCIYMGAPLTVDIARLVGFEAGIVARSWAPEPCARKWA